MQEAPGSQRAPHETFEACLRVAASRRWRWHTAEGLSLILLGAGSLMTASAANSPLMGAILLCAGSMGFLSLLRAEHCPSFGLSLLLALVAFAMGLHLLTDPPKATLGLAFAVYFFSRGAATILLAVALRRRCFREWEWSAVSGVTSLILAALILSGLPGPYVWMLGLLLGVSLIFEGSALLALVMAADTASETVSAPVSAEARARVMPSGGVCEDGLRA